jgi:CheY-like chemotaxis protein
VLYVEDNPTNQLLMSEIFARMDDIQLTMASSAEEGLEIARRAPPDLVIMDINLPGMSGFDALERLSDDAATAHIPVIALTAMAGPQDIARGLAAGFHEYLTKPADVAQVIAAVERHLGLK